MRGGGDDAEAGGAGSVDLLVRGVPEVVGGGCGAGGECSYQSKAEG
jgi:hypothetical protein